MKKRREGGKEERGRRDVEVKVRERQRDSNIGRSADADCDPHFVILKEFFFIIHQVCLQRNIMYIIYNIYSSTDDFKMDEYEINRDIK